MTVTENQEEINILKNKIYHIEKILDLLHPIWRYEELEQIEEFKVKE
jgi:hypothetical protein